MQLLVAPVPPRRRKHSLADVECALEPPICDRFEQDLRVGRPTKRATLLLQPSSDGPMVVDLTVVRHDPSAVARNHRLRTTGPGVDDGQSPVAERDAALRI